MDLVREQNGGCLASRHPVAIYVDNPQLQGRLGGLQLFTYATMGTAGSTLKAPAVLLADGWPADVLPAGVWCMLHNSMTARFKFPREKLQC